MSINVSAGVYPTELDLSEYVRSITAFKVGMVAITDRGLEGREGARVEIRNWDDFQMRCGGFRDDSYGAYAAKMFFDNGGGSLYVSRVYATNADGTAKTAKRATASIAGVMEIEAHSFGVWGNAVSVEVSPNAAVYADGFDILVKHNGQMVERYTHLTFDENSNDFADSKARSSFIRLKTIAPPEVASPLVKTTLALTGGNDGGTGVADADYIRSIQHFRDSPITVLMVPGITSESVIDAAIQFASDRGDLISIFETPEGLTVDGAILFRENSGYPFNSSFGAMYYPWLITRHPVSNAKKTIPPTGAIAGIFSRGSVWDAPAGLNRGVLSRITGTENMLDEQLDRDKLYERQLNPIASFLDTGAVVWGQKTLQKRPTSLDRINVRNIVNHIKKAVTVQSKSLLFEPHTPKLWQRFKRNTAPFLQKLVDNQGLYEFLIVCDETVNTPQVIEQNRMIAKIFLQPTKTAEIIELQFVITPTGVDFSEFAQPVN